MNNQPLVSVVISFLNAERFLREAIESVCAQTWEDWELLLVDDGSTDGSRDIGMEYVRKFPSRVRSLEHARHQNRGLPASRNLGIANARGEFIAPLDADDVWLPGKLEEQVRILRCNPGAAMVYGPSQRWYSWTGRAEDADRDYMPTMGVPVNALSRPPTLLTLSLERKATTPCPSNVLLRREAVERVGRFEESFCGDKHLYEDQAFFAKINASMPAFVSSTSWDRYRRHPDSVEATVKRKGRGFAVRGEYLRWLEQYLAAEGIEDAQLWSVLHRQLWPYRHPLLFRTAEKGRSAWRGLRTILKPVVPGRQSAP